MSKVREFNPKLVGIICNWCCYGGADLCGVSRLQYPPYIKLIRVMCSGRVDLAHIIRAFADGNDGVFIGGCHLNDCHYITNGNFNVLAMVKICKMLLERIGLNPARLRLEWVSAGEGVRFASIMNEFGPAMQKLGALGKSEGLDEHWLKFQLEAVAKLIPYIKLVERERLRVPSKIKASSEPEEEYEKFFSSDEMKKIFDEAILDNLAINNIVSLLRERPLSTEQMAEKLRMTPSEVSRHIRNSSKQVLFSYDDGQKCFALA
jgi:coenzyme F420-reducing hydrogenase delta subunit